MEEYTIYDNFQKNISYDVACFSEIGKRESQQDSAYAAADDGNLIAVVCDGMGGFEGGAKASRTAVEAFVECYQCYAGDANADTSWMRKTADRLDEIVYNLKDEAGKRLGAGTTLAAVWMVGKSLAWVSVGDSRIYLQRGDEQLRITSDHNYFLEINKKRDEGRLSGSEYEKESESGEALISFIGMGGLLMTDISGEPVELVVGDTVFICSDGVYRALSDEAIRQIILKGSDSEMIKKAICESVKAANMEEQDNYSGIVIRIK